MRCEAHPALPTARLISVRQLCFYGVNAAFQTWPFARDCFVGRVALLPLQGVQQALKICPQVINIFQADANPQIGC